MAKKEKKKTTDEIIEEVSAIFHLEGMDIPPEELEVLRKHIEAGTLDEYEAQLIREAHKDGEV